MFNSAAKTTKLRILIPVSCSMLQWVAVRCTLLLNIQSVSNAESCVLQCFAECYSVLQSVAECCRMLQSVAVRGFVLQCAAENTKCLNADSRVLQSVAAC